MNLVPYAGMERWKQPLVKRAPTRRRRTRSQMAYDLFRLGNDTADLAVRLDVQEATILRWITYERSRRLGLPHPYGETL